MRFRIFLRKNILIPKEIRLMQRKKQHKLLLQTRDVSAGLHNVCGDTRTLSHRTQKPLRRLLGFGETALPGI